jgi:hypothetical protein
MNKKDAGQIEPNSGVWYVTNAKQHKTLRKGDTCFMVEDPNLNNWLLRLTPGPSLHKLQDNRDQYVELFQIK